MARKRKVIQPGPVKGYPVTQPKEDRPSLGWGMAEEAAKDLESRGSKVDKAVDKATGNKKEPRWKQQ